MADAAVEFVLNNLKDLLLHHSHLITNNKEKIESLKMDLGLFNAFLKESSKKRRKDEVTKLLVQNIRDVAYELDDVIDAFVTNARERKQSSFLNFWKPALDLHDIGQNVEIVKEKVEKAKIEFASLRDDDEDRNGKPEVRRPREKDVVGFADVTEELIVQLTEETFEVVSLVGTFGLGKTTLAWKIFNDPKIVTHFPVRIWLTISQDFSDRDIFLAILKKFTTTDEDTRHSSDEEIARMAADYLKKGTFLIVMDDVWNQADWNRLRIALPQNSKKGKVLITSRIEKVGRYVSAPKRPKKLRFFTEDESWELLQLEALRSRECPPELETIGKLIARDCDGLPLSIVIIGGILATEYSASDTTSMIKGWEKVSQRVNTYINEKDPEKLLVKFISLSYDILPYHLRACFLYLGMFPEDYEIPVSKLIQMWIGEGLIQRHSDDTLEDTGEMYLDDLINRNLVIIGKFKAGKVKTCRVHDTLRDFIRGENENFLQEIKYKPGTPIDGIQKYRHLSIHSNCREFISLKPFGPRVRSFVCFSKDLIVLPPENIADILKAFKLVRVLDIKPIKFTRMSSDMYQLVHARYIALSFDLSILPSKFSQLWNIQTLVVDTTSPTLDVKADIWNLSRLRHFKTNVPATLPNPDKNSKHGAELQTLGTISVESCTAQLVKQACNLKKLAIYGRLEALLVEGENGFFDTLGKMKSFEKLKLVNDVYCGMSGVTQHYRFPSNLKSLTLIATNLEWNLMTTIGLLQKLEVLKLKERAFVGPIWKVSDGGFRRLELLQIEDTDLSDWEASSDHFPTLKGLVLKYCDNLGEIPMGLAARLEKLELFLCSSAAESSSKRIHEAKKAEGSTLKLYILSTKK